MPAAMALPQEGKGGSQKGESEAEGERWAEGGRAVEEGGREVGGREGEDADQRGKGDEQSTVTAATLARRTRWGEAPRQAAADYL